MCKGTGCETRCLLGKHMCPFLPASFLTSRLSPCHHPRPLHSVLQTEAARTDFLKCESDHVSLSLLQNLQGLILPLKTSKKAEQTLSIFPCPASPADLAPAPVPTCLSAVKEHMELHTPRKWQALLPCRSSLSNMPSLGLGPDEPSS